MNLDRERELFERYEHSKKPCANRNKLFEVFTKDGLDVDEYHYIGKYVCSFMQEKWELWQASASRDGYKLVPVDFLKRCDDHLYTAQCYEGDSNENLNQIIDDSIALKAMLGAIE